MTSAASWLDTLLITSGIGFLVVRQFFWRAADPAQLLKLPLAIIGIGAAWVLWDSAQGKPLTLLNLAVLGAEALLVFATGCAMGLLTQLREHGGVLSSRLAPSGVVLWCFFLTVRVGSFLLADKLGAHLLDTTGAITISFGLNRLASSLIVKDRIKHRKYELRMQR